MVTLFNGTYHWVLVGPADRAGEAVVSDSLKAQPETVPIDALLDDALSITLVEPSTSEGKSATFKPVATFKLGSFEGGLHVGRRT